MNGTYLLVDALFLAPCLLIQAVAWPRRRPGHARALLVAVAGLVLLTVVFDSLMIAGGLFTYAPERISGLRIGLAPVEDLAYPIAAALLGTALWSLRDPEGRLGRNRSAEDRTGQSPRDAAARTPEEPSR